MIPVLTVGLLDRSRIQFRRYRTGSTNTGIIHIAVYRYVDRAVARIGAVVVLGYGECDAVGCRVRLVAHAADDDDLDHAVSGVEVVVSPADLPGRIISAIIGPYGYSFAGADRPRVRLVHIDRHPVIPQPVMAGARHSDEPHLRGDPRGRDQSDADLPRTARDVFRAGASVAIAE